MAISPETAFSREGTRAEHDPAGWGLDRVLLHKPLLWLAVTMIALSIVATIGLVVDPRETLGAPLWAKPLKFGISIALYCLTLAWLMGMLSRHRRIAWWLGTISALFLVVEMIVITGAAALGSTSHFNVATPLTAALWSVMAVSIVIVWAAALVVAVLLWRQRIADPARSLAIKSGIIVGIIGMGLAFLMTSPTAQQLSNFQGIAGAHTVGLPDGGAGLPLLGWSTIAGDLRIPHFVGMHALQVLPLSVLLLEILSARPPTPVAARAASNRDRVRWPLRVNHRVVDGASTLWTINRAPGCRSRHDSKRAVCCRSGCYRHHSRPHAAHTSGADSLDWGDAGS